MNTLEKISERLDGIALAPESTQNERLLAKSVQEISTEIQRLEPYKEMAAEAAVLEFEARVTGGATMASVRYTKREAEAICRAVMARATKVERGSDA